MKRIAEYEIVDHGLDHVQYFQGCGVAFTDFDEVRTGCGDTYQEALDDALESLAQDDWDTESNAELTAEIKEAETLDSPSASAEDPSEDSELNYYVSVRVKGVESEVKS